MTEETAEEKLARYEFVLDAYVRELTALREENARLRSEGGAHGVLRDVYLNRDLPESLRTKAAGLALQHEVPRLLPEKAPLELTAEPESEPLVDLVSRQRARCDQMLRDDPQFQALRSRQVILLEPNGNSGNGSTSDDNHS
jgi:hypothetical protein